MTSCETCPQVVLVVSLVRAHLMVAKAVGSGARTPTFPSMTSSLRSLAANLDMVAPIPPPKRILNSRLCSAIFRTVRQGQTRAADEKAQLEEATAPMPIRLQVNSKVVPLPTCLVGTNINIANSVNSSSRHHTNTNNSEHNTRASSRLGPHLRRLLAHHTKDLQTKALRASLRFRRSSRNRAVAAHRSLS
eukprot:m.286062 g.286062  ORF g.286062 m.286062 type:complete len:190 (-) comp54981_c0_seq2:1783-2352(-)